MNKSEALAAGAPRYNSYEPCANGHTGNRLTATDECCTCLSNNLSTGPKTSELSRKLDELALARELKEYDL